MMHNEDGRIVVPATGTYIASTDGGAHVGIVVDGQPDPAPSASAATSTLRPTASRSYAAWWGSGTSRDEELSLPRDPAEPLVTQMIAINYAKASSLDCWSESTERTAADSSFSRPSKPACRAAWFSAS